MSSPAIRAALVTLLAAIPDIGRVHAYERFATGERGLLDHYTAAGAVRGWYVSRIASSRLALGSGRVLVTDRWAIVGLLSLVDGAASEIAASDLADAIIAAERADPTLGGVARGRPVDGAAGIQLAGLEPVMFAGVLCHKVTLRLAVESYEGADASTGMLAAIPGATGRLVSVIAQRIKDRAPAGMFAAVEGRLAVDRRDDPEALPAALVTLVADEATPDPETAHWRQRVDRRVAVTVVAPSAHVAGAGALAAGGLDVLRSAVREALLAWGDAPAGVADVPCLYAGGAPAEAAPGLVAWSDLYLPSIYLEAQP